MDKKLETVFSYQNWRQSIEVEPGIYTPGHITSDMWSFVGLPDSLKEKSFLDVGSNDGMFSFLAEKKGATEIVSSDLYKDSIDTMQNGWSNEGINLLIEQLHSKIKLHNKGIYHLDELNKQFDVVLVNNIINWLDDIELGFNNLSKATKGTLYLSDGFLTDNTTPECKKQNGRLRYMYNLSFIENLLKKNGFSIESVTELNYQKVFVKKFLNTPTIEIVKGTKVYQFPDLNAPYQEVSEDLKSEGNGIYNNFYHIDKKGWVSKENIKVSYKQPSLVYKMVNVLGLKELYFRNSNNSQKKATGIISYTIKANKK